MKNSGAKRLNITMNTFNHNFSDRKTEREGGGEGRGREKEGKK
jgi:hypothetical protein